MMPELVLGTARSYLRKALERLEADPVGARLECLSAVAALDASPDLTRRPVSDTRLTQKGSFGFLKLGNRRIKCRRTGSVTHPS